MVGARRVLVVDDQAEITDLVSEIARGERCVVRALNDSREFFDTFDVFRPEAVCLDIHMPEVDGIEILQWLAERKSAVGVVILSGGDPLFARVAGRIGEAGHLVVTIIEKPFAVADLRKALNSTFLQLDANLI